MPAFATISEYQILDYAYMYLLEKIPRQQELLKSYNEELKNKNLDP